MRQLLNVVEDDVGADSISGPKPISESGNDPVPKLRELFVLVIPEIDPAVGPH
jgi:hypothetical protein